MALCSLSDAELWTLILKNDYRAFTALFDRYWLKMYKSANRYLHDAEASEEVVQDMFLTVWNRKDHLLIHDFEKYFKAAIRYQTYAYVKKHKDAPIAYVEQLNDNEYNVASGNADTALIYQELEYKLNQHLSLLPMRCKEIFIMSRVQNFSNYEIAQKLGINKRTVENQLTHALQSIRVNMKNILYSVTLLIVLLS